MNKHTPGPWIVNSGNGEIVTTERRIATTQVGGLYDVSNAERIVACVNALEGIDDPEAFIKQLLIACQSALIELEHLPCRGNEDHTICLKCVTQTRLRKVIARAEGVEDGKVNKNTLVISHDGRTYSYENKAEGGK